MLAMLTVDTIGSLSPGALVPQPHMPENARPLLQERTFGKFTRTINLPQQVDTEAIEASYENGVLTLQLPKTPEVQPKLISVRNGQSGQRQLSSQN